MDRLLFRADFVIRKDTDHRTVANRCGYFCANALNSLLEILFHRIVVKGEFGHWELLKFIAL